MTTAVTRSVELMLKPYLAAAVSVPVTVDPEYDFAVPLLAIERVGGTHDGFRIDRPLVDVDAFHATREGAEALAWAAFDAFQALEGTTQRGLVVSRVHAESAPRQIAYGSNRSVRRFVATYELTIHAA
jgi:hypothetical protein